MSTTAPPAPLLPSNAVDSTGPITAADGTPLQTALSRATRKARIRAFLLVAPLLAFVVLTFVAPIGQMLWRSVSNDSFSANMPALTAWFAENEALGSDGGPEGDGIPGEDAFEALATDLKGARENRTAGIVGTRVNYDLSGTRSLFTKSARQARKLEAPFKAALLDVDEDWGDAELWSVMRSASRTYTGDFYLAALDMQRNVDGEIEAVPENRRIYVPLFVRTLWLSALIAGLCLLLAFPVAHLLARLPLRYSNILMIFVLLPFWTSLLVRTTSWMVMLQSQGVVNDLMVAVGIVGDDGRIQMMYNQAGTIIAMTHILLPFMILPLYSVMKTIPHDYVRAARSLGATPSTAFWRIYFPQTVPGIGAGVLLVFILAVGYYITPALVGGSSGQLISNLIAFHMQKSLNWSLAAALAALLLAGVMLLYWLYDRLIGIDNMKFG